jgi:hypothetical protein
MNAELEELEQATEKLTEHTRDLLADWEKPLKLVAVDSHGERVEKRKHNVLDHYKIEEGILWIPGPFANDFWTGLGKKPKPAKCTCPHCGTKHNLKR